MLGLKSSDVIFGRDTVKSEVIEFFIFENSKAGIFYNLSCRDVLEIFNFETADADLVGLKHKAIGIDDINVLFSKSRCKFMEVAGLVGDGNGKDEGG